MRELRLTIIMAHPLQIRQSDSGHCRLLLLSSSPSIFLLGRNLLVRVSGSYRRRDDYSAHGCSAPLLVLRSCATVAIPLTKLHRRYIDRRAILCLLSKCKLPRENCQSWKALGERCRMILKRLFRSHDLHARFEVRW